MLTRVETASAEVRKAARGALRTVASVLMENNVILIACALPEVVLITFVRQLAEMENVIRIEENPAVPVRRTVGHVRRMTDPPVHMVMTVRVVIVYTVHVALLPLTVATDTVKGKKIAILVPVIVEHARRKTANDALLGSNAKVTTAWMEPADRMISSVVTAAVRSRRPVATVHKTVVSVHRPSNRVESTAREVPNA